VLLNKEADRTILYSPHQFCYCFSGSMIP